VTRTITTDWGSGFCAEVTVRPASVVPVTWSAELQVGGTITSIWDATTPGSSGTVTVRGASWNPTASAGSPVKFGYCAQR
jgi:endoglucanase